MRPELSSSDRTPGNVLPAVNAADVERAVRRSYEQFTGSPIRDFVPLLVERMTREGLNENRAGLLSASRI